MGEQEKTSQGEYRGEQDNPPHAELNGLAQQSRTLAGGPRMDRSNPSDRSGKLFVFEKEWLKGEERWRRQEEKVAAEW